MATAIKNVPNTKTTSSPTSKDTAPNPLNTQQEIVRDPWGVTPSGSPNTIWQDGSVTPAPGGVPGTGSDPINIGTLPPLSDEDYLAGDSQYQAQLAALMRALQDSTADFEAQKSRYTTSFDDSLRSLGWNPGMEDDPNTVDVNEFQPGAWNRTDLNTASGRAIQNQTNDFASRGMLQSSLFAQSQDNLMRSLADQLGGMQTAKTGFMDDIARQLSGVQNQNTLDQQNAKAEALARRAAGMSLV